MDEGYKAVSARWCGIAGFEGPHAVVDCAGEGLEWSILDLNSLGVEMLEEGGLKVGNVGVCEAKKMCDQSSGVEIE